jgi:DNA-nicking Smr family endonuclease
MHKPFAVLEDLVRSGRLKVAGGTLDGENREQRDFDVPRLPSGMADEDLFGHAMQDVKALGWSAVPLHHRPPLEIQPQDDEAEALRVLEEFLKRGDLEIDQMPEYIEGAVQPRGRLYLQDLRSGRFAVQAWLDLHGMNQQEARFALDEFLLASVRASFSCVRVIHGRGRHSHKKEPVLKDAIQRWLCSRRLSRHVVAYTSARLCDGGGGAVYILLRS